MCFDFLIHHFCFRIVTQPRLPWWPQIDLVYARSEALRNLFTDTLNKATQGYIAHTPLRMITSLTLKAKDGQNRLTRPEDGIAHKTLLLLMVRLVHTDPMLLLNVRSNSDQLNSDVVRIKFVSTEKLQQQSFYREFNFLN